MRGVLYYFIAVSVIGALVALRHWMRLSARGRLRERARPGPRRAASPADVAARQAARGEGAGN